MSVGETNVSVSEDLLPHIPSGRCVWRKAGRLMEFTPCKEASLASLPHGDDSFLFHEQLTLEVPE